MKRRTRFPAGLFVLSLLAALAWPSAIQAGLVAYWPFNEGSGMTVKDRSTNHNDGAFHALQRGANPTWVAGHTGKEGDYALKFDQGFVEVQAAGDATHISVPPGNSAESRPHPAFTRPLPSGLRTALAQAPKLGRLIIATVREPVER